MSGEIQHLPSSLQPDGNLRPRVRMQNGRAVTFRLSLLQAVAADLNDSGIQFPVYGLKKLQGVSGTNVKGKVKTRRIRKSES